MNFNCIINSFNNIIGYSIFANENNRPMSLLIFSGRRNKLYICLKIIDNQKGLFCEAIRISNPHESFQIKRIQIPFSRITNVFDKVLTIPETIDMEFYKEIAATLADLLSSLCFILELAENQFEGKETQKVKRGT